MPKAKPSPSSRTDWNKLRTLPEAEIEHIAEQDADNPPRHDWAGAQRGIPPLLEQSEKTSVHAKFDADIVNWFKAQGRGYQTRMNAALRRYMETNRTMK